MKKMFFIVSSWLFSVLSIAEPVSPQKSVSYQQSVLEMLLGLVIVVGLIIGLVWLMKKLGHVGNPAIDTLKISGCLPLSQKEKLFLVNVGDEQVLIGVAPGFVGHIKTLPKSLDDTQRNTSHLDKEHQISSKETLSFSDQLKAVLSKKTSLEP